MIEVKQDCLGNGPSFWPGIAPDNKGTTARLRIDRLAIEAARLTCGERLAEATRAVLFNLMKTYTARYEGGKDDGRVIYARRPVGNLIGELPLGSGPISDPKQSLDRQDGGDVWDHAVFMTAESRRRIVITADPDSPLDEMMVDNFQVMIEGKHTLEENDTDGKLTSTQFNAIMELLPRRLRHGWLASKDSNFHKLDFDREAPTTLLQYLRKEGIRFKLYVSYQVH